MASVVECNSAPVSKQAKASTVLKKRETNWVPKPQVPQTQPKLKLTFYLIGSCPFPRSRFAGLGKHLAVRSLSFILVGSLRSNDADDKAIGLISRTTTSHVQHTFLFISFPFLHDYDVKMPNFAFYGGRKQATTKFYFSF